MRISSVVIGFVLVALWSSPREARAADRTFPSGSLIIPMDLSYQSRGMFQAYGLLYQLLRQGVRVYWVIDPNKTYHAAPCNTPGDLCAWDCAVEGSGVKCPYPTSSPDFLASAKVVWSDAGTAPNTTISHRYRGGPFVIDAADRAAAIAIINVWNDPAQWAANPWAMRSTFSVVTVHEATAAFTGNVTKEMIAAPTIAVFSDGNETIATGYLRAAGIPQSNGREFPSANCGATNCGPGTLNPDMLSPEAVAGDLGTCGAPNKNHKNGALFRSDGLPAYCQIMSMHWNVSTRETVQCGGGNCPATQAECPPNTPITFHGHETVAEVRSFLHYPVHFFAECQAVNAYENTTPNPAWPYLDDAGRDGHFLTDTGTPQACPCTDADFECVNNTCVPKDDREKGAGFLIASAPATNAVKVLRPDVPYNQFDGAFAPVGGSEPAYNLSSYLNTKYKNNQQVTLLTGPTGPGASDLWMTGYLDGKCDLEDPPIFGPPPQGGKPRAVNSCGGKISYLGGHQFSTNTPVASGSSGMGTRLFLNALFEAECVTAAGQPELALDLTPLVIGVSSFPADAPLTATYSNLAVGPALDATFVQRAPAEVAIVAADGGTIAGQDISWNVGAISGNPVHAGDPPSAGTRIPTMRFTAPGDYTFTLSIRYTVGSTQLVKSAPFVVHVGLDSDGDGVPDDTDLDPDDPFICGDTDLDGCDDCTSGRNDPANDACDNGGTGDKAAGCCSVDGGGPAAPLALSVLGLVFLLRPRAKRRSRRC